MLPSQYLSLWWPSRSQSCCTWSWRRWRRPCSWCCTSSPWSYRSDPWSCSCEWRHHCPGPWPRRKLHCCCCSRSLRWRRLRIPSWLTLSEAHMGLEEMGHIRSRTNQGLSTFTLTGDDGDDQNLVVVIDEPSYRVMAVLDNQPIATLSEPIK